jgi:hypothetical protein
VTGTPLKEPWCVGAHYGARDDYQLPIALQEVGQLHRFVTDWCSPLDHPTLGAMLKNAPERVRAILASRYLRPVAPLIALLMMVFLGFMSLLVSNWKTYWVLLAIMLYCISSKNQSTAPTRWNSAVILERSGV